MPLVVVALVPLLVVAGVVMAAVRVYDDARAQAANGMPVVLRFGTFEIATPGMWLRFCLVVPMLFLPLYVICRNQAG